VSRVVSDAVSSVAYSWEFTLLRRLPGAGKPRVAGRFVIQAPTAADARREAMAELAKRREGESRWSLGVLKPLTPQAPGTSPFAVTFAVWEAADDRFVRRDVHTLEVWAEDAGAARRIAQQDIQTAADYNPAWRIRQVVRGEMRRRKRT
jgi:hypothetical protein